MIELIDELVESDSSSNLMDDNELIEEAQVQEVNVLLDSPHPSPSMIIEPLPDIGTEPLRPSTQVPS